MANPLYIFLSRMYDFFTIYKELDRWKNLVDIVKTDYLEWTAPTVYIKRTNNTIRICADFSASLNKSLLSPAYSLPTPEDIFAKLNAGVRFFGNRPVRYVSAG